MKKIALTIAIVLGIGLSVFAQNQNVGGLFRYGDVSDDDYYSSAWFALDQNTEFQRINGLLPGLPGHGEYTNQNAPLGSGALLLIGFGATYALRKRKKLL